jgi:hypothetical protein
MFDIYVVNECLKLPSNINNYTAACLPILWPRMPKGGETLIL